MNYYEITYHDGMRDIVPMTEKVFNELKKDIEKANKRLNPQKGRTPEKEIFQVFDGNTRELLVEFSLAELKEITLLIIDKEEL